MRPEQEKVLEAVQRFKNLYKSLKGNDIDGDDLARMLIYGMEYEDMRKELTEKCEQIGRMGGTLMHAQAELYFYQKRYGRLDVWDECFEARKNKEIN